MSPDATRRALDFASIAFVVLVPALALATDDGDWRLGLLFPPAVLLVSAQVATRWRGRAAFGAALGSLLCLVAAHAIVLTFALPTNQVSVNWKAKPATSSACARIENLTEFVALLVAVLMESASAKAEEPGRSLGRALGSRGILSR